MSPGQRRLRRRTSRRHVELHCPFSSLKHGERKPSKAWATPPSPSMRMVVKPLQAFFLAARTDRAAGLVPLSHRLPALFPSILSPPPPSPHPGLGEGGDGERMLLPSPRPGPLGRARGSDSASGRLACASVRAPGPNDRLSVGDRPRPPAPSTVYASSVRHATSKSPSIERTVPGQVTRRQNDGSYRPRLAPPRRLAARRLSSPPLAFAVTHHPRHASAAAALACRRAVESTRKRQSFSSAPSGHAPRSR